MPIDLRFVFDTNVIISALFGINSVNQTLIIQEQK